MAASGFIRNSILAPSASLAPQGGRWSQHQRDHYKYLLEAYPIVYGTNVWVKQAPIISERTLPDGKIERIQVVSVGQFAGDVGGYLGEIEAQIYDSCCRKVAGTMDIRLGKVKQDAISTAFYVPCADCCPCPATGDGPVFADTANRIEVSLDAQIEPDTLNAWVVLADDVAIATVWANTPARYLFRVEGATAVSVLPIPDATPVAPYYKLDESVTQNTIGRITGNLTAAQYTGTPVTLPDTSIESTAVLSDIDPTCSGLAVVKTVTDCKSRPVFRVLKGRQGRALLAAGEVQTTLEEALRPQLNGGGLTVGGTIENQTTGKRAPITDAKTVPALEIKPGDAYLIWNVDTLKALPEVYVDLVTSIGGGLNELVSKFSLDYAYLQQANDYCFQRGYWFNGVVTKQPISYFLQDAACQSGLIVTRRENRTGLYPADPNKTPTRVYTVSNTNDGQIVWEPYDYHAANRLVINYANAAKCGYSTVIAQDSKLKDERLAVVEEALRWNYVDNTEQATDLAIQYFNAIRFDRIVCSFTATTPVYYLEPGEIFEFTTPLWETAGEFSGHASEGTKPGYLVPSWEPILHYGTDSQIDGTTITNSVVDYTKLVAVGDLVVSGEVAIAITAVTPQTLTLATPLASNAQFRILDLTLDDGYTLTWDAWTTSKNKGYNKLAVTPTWDTTLKRVVYTGVDVNPGDAVVLAKYHWTWRCASVEPLAQGAFRVYGTVYYSGHDELIRTHLIT